MIENLSGEWNRRTWYGKLWYPVWLCSKAVVALAAAFLVTLVYLLVGHPLSDAASYVSATAGPKIRSAAARIRGATPEVYYD